MDGPRSPPRPMTETEREQFQKKLHEKQQHNNNNQKQEGWQPSAPSSSPPSDNQTDAWDRVRKNEQQRESDPWNDTFDKSQTGLDMAEKEWMDKDGSPTSNKSHKNKWGDEMS